MFLENKSNRFFSKGESESKEQPWHWWILLNFLLYSSGACQGFVAKLKESLTLAEVSGFLLWEAVVSGEPFYENY